MNPWVKASHRPHNAGIDCREEENRAEPSSETGVQDSTPISHRPLCREHAPREPLGATYDRHPAKGAPKGRRLIGAGCAISDPTRWLADSGAPDRPTNSLEFAANVLYRSMRSSALGRRSNCATNSSAVDRCHPKCFSAVDRRPVRSKRSSAVERELKWIG